MFAGDLPQAIARHRELAALTEAGSDYIRSAYCAHSLWALGAAAWRRGDLDRATGLQQQSLRLRRDDRMGTTFSVGALAWIAASRHQYERAAVLLGAAAGLLRSMGTTLPFRHDRVDSSVSRQTAGCSAALLAGCHDVLDGNRLRPHPETDR